MHESVGIGRGTMHTSMARSSCAQRLQYRGARRQKVSDGSLEGVTSKLKHK